MGSRGDRVSTGRLRRGLLLVDHGSRAAEANAVLETLAATLRERDPSTPIRVAHLELASPGIDEGLAALADDGVDEVVVYPHFLAPGRHSRDDIPERVTRAAAAHPGLRVRLAEPLGTHPGLLDIILERIAAATALPGVD